MNNLEAINYGPHGAYGYYVFYPYNNQGAPEYGITLNDVNDSIGFGFHFRKTATISGVGFHINEYVGTPDYAMTFVTISGDATFATDSVPDVDPNTRVANHYSNAQWQDFKPTVVGSGWNWIDLATPVNVTRGDSAAFVIIPSGATVPSTSHYCKINDEQVFANPYPGTFYYYSTWYHQNDEAVAAIKYTDNTIQGIPVVWYPYETYASPEEWGVEFTLPFTATCVAGVFNLYPDPSPKNAPFKLILADANDAELASCTITDYDFVDNYSNYNIRLWWDTATDPVLQANTVYRLYLKPTSSQILNKTGVGLELETWKEGLPGGTDWKWIERPSPASGWTYQPTYYPWMSVALTNIQGGTSGTGSGGDGGSYGFIG